MLVLQNVTTQTATATSHFWCKWFYGVESVPHLLRLPKQTVWYPPPFKVPSTYFHLSAQAHIQVSSTVVTSELTVFICHSAGWVFDQLVSLQHISLAEVESTRPAEAVC